STLEGESPSSPSTRSYSDSSGSRCSKDAHGTSSPRTSCSASASPPPGSSSLPSNRPSGRTSAMAGTGGLRIALFTQHVSHHPAARFQAATLEIPDARVFSLVNSADFREFLSDDAQARQAVRVFEGQEAYEGAVRSGALWLRIHSELAAFSPDVVVVAGWSF